VAQSVSCTIFAYNEEATLEEATRDVHGALSALGDRDFEVLLVDDGSTDRTYEIARRMEKELSHVRLIRHGRNMGPGSAILTGIRNSTKDLVCFHAADQQLDFREVAGFLPLLDQHDIVIGSRSARPGYTQMRMLASHVYIGLVHGLFGLRQYDDFNFLYLYRRSLLEKMPIESNGVFLCTEILVRAVEKGAQVAHVTAECKPRMVGVSSCFRAPVIGKTFGEMFGFWARQRGLLG
jgi:glycosyltransferase involved in cell wall biosynthesis